MLMIFFFSSHATKKGSPNSVSLGRVSEGPLVGAENAQEKVSHAVVAAVETRPQETPTARHDLQGHQAGGHPGPAAAAAVLRRVVVERRHDVDHGAVVVKQQEDERR